MKINIGQKEIIHFIGMGGIGMSGLAQIMKIMGFKVQGSDISLNKNIENCKKLGIKFFLGQKKKNIKDATILVKSFISTVIGAPATLQIDWSVKINPVFTWSRTVIVTGSVSEKQICPLYVLVALLLNAVDCVIAVP